MICVGSWSRRPGWRSNITPTGKPSLSGWPHALANKKRLLLWLESCSWRVFPVLNQQEADCHAQVEAITRKLLNWISHTGTIPGKKRDRLLLLYDYLDQLGLSEGVEEIHSCGSTYRLSERQKQLRATRQKG